VVTVDIFRPAFSNAAAALVLPGRSKRHAADGFCVTNSHRDRDYYEHTSFDATDVPAQVASQQRAEAQETLFPKGIFSAAHRAGRRRLHAKNRRMGFAPARPSVQFEYPAPGVLTTSFRAPC
jgi:hypothetical protein